MSPSRSQDDHDTRRIEIGAGPSGVINGDLSVPPGARGLVVFAHGSGSSRRSPRNLRVADALRARGLGTLLFDLLTETEEAVDEQTAHLRFRIPLLARRLETAVSLADRELRGTPMPIGLFGASTGAAAALVAAANRPDRIAAVVGRGGRPDLAADALGNVRAPTLLIVGADDHVVLGLNREAASRLRCTNELAVVPGATHLFEERGALAAVAQLAGDWFIAHLSMPVRARDAG